MTTKPPKVAKRAAALLAGIAALGGAAAIGAPARTAAPDAVYYDGKVYTVDDALGTQSAFAVRGERIVAVGRDAAVLALAGKATRRVDLHGAAVIPGLNDSHDHFWNNGRYLVRGVDLIGVSSRTELEARLRAAVARARPGEVVYTTIGWAVQPMPTRADLDAISATVPIALISNRRAVAMLNSAALQRLGVSKEHPNYRGAPVPVDKAGEPTGEPAGYPVSVQMIEALLPPLTPAIEDKIAREAMAEHNALGITGVRELALWPSGLAALQRIRREGKLTLRIAVGVEFPDQDNTAQHLAEMRSAMALDPWLSLDTYSEEPWAPGSTSPEKFTTLARAVNRLGWRAAPHASSDSKRGIAADAAMEATLAGYEAANRDSPLPGKRWYVEHVPFSTPAQMDRLAALGLIVSTQDAGFAPPAVAPMPADRMAHWNPIRGFLDHKLVVIGGSDYNGPTPADRTPNNPFHYFYFYVTRHNNAGGETAPTERVSRAEALRIFTANAAYATRQERERGRIAPGLLADFLILNQDVMTVPDDKIPDTRPLATFVGGRKVYSAPGASY